MTPSFTKIFSGVEDEILTDVLERKYHTDYDIVNYLRFDRQSSKGSLNILFYDVLFLERNH